MISGKIFALNPLNFEFFKNKSAIKRYFFKNFKKCLTDNHLNFNAIFDVSLKIKKRKSMVKNCDFGKILIKSH